MAAGYEKWLDCDLDLEGGGGRRWGVGVRQRKGYDLWPDEKLLHFVTPEHKEFFFSLFNFTWEIFLEIPVTYWANRGVMGSWIGPLDHRVWLSVGTGRRAHSHGSPAEGLSVFKANHHRSLEMLPAHSLPRLCLRNAWKSLQKTKAWWTEACPKRLPGKRVPVSLLPRFSGAQVQLWPGLPQHILGPPMSSHQRDPPQKAAGSGWSTGWATDWTSPSVTGTRSLRGPLWARLPWAPHVLGLDPQQKATLLFRRSPATWRRHQVIFLSHPAIHPQPP